MKEQKLDITIKVTIPEGSIEKTDIAKVASDAVEKYVKKQLTEYFAFQTTWGVKG